MRRWIRQKQVARKKSAGRQAEPTVPSQTVERYKDSELTDSLEENLAIFEQALGDSDDYITYPFHVFGRFPAAMLYLSTIIDQTVVNEDVLKPCMHVPRSLEESAIELSQLEQILLRDSLYHGKARLEQRMDKLFDAVLSGKTAIMIDGLNKAIVVETRKVEKRGIEQPMTEGVIRGPREGFIEHLLTNLGLLRYRLPTADFRIKLTQIGRITKSNVAICYIKGIVNDALVQEVERRLDAIDIDGILDSGHLEQFIEDNHFSPFPQVQNTERPDKAVANLLEGRVVILVDGSPFALIVPTVFNQFYQVTEDYTERYIPVSFIRLARLIALVFSLVTPSLYVAVLSFNPELIPTEFVVAVAGGRAGVPFPTVVEVFIMEISMEVLREATVRLPQQVGGALSIVGVLVIGQAAVSAGFVSPITVVIIALTTIGSFATPAYNAALALRLLRFPLIALGGAFGLYGVMIGLILIANHLLSLKSFGVPYMSPIVPGSYQGMKDSVLRMPLWWMKKRPSFLHSPNKERVGGSSGAQLKHPHVNTLDPLKVGNERWNATDGVSSTDHGDSTRGDSH
jgi:spore germination protein KA